jgi:WD40 repeat protein
MKLWDVASGAEIRTFSGHSNRVSSVTFSPDGRYALSGSYDKTLKLWELASGDEIRTFNGHSSYVYFVAISPNGRYALSGSADNTLKLWEVSGAEIRTFSGHSDGVVSVAFSPDGLYALSGADDKTLKLWEVASGAEILTFRGHSSGVKSVTFSPDGRYALSGSADNTMKLWEVANGTEIRTFSGHSNRVGSVAFSPDGRYALSGSYDKTLKLWETGLVKPNTPPTGSFSLSTTHGVAPLTVRFDAHGSTDDHQIVQYDWFFNGNIFASVNTPNALSYTFSPGTYQISLTVTDNEGLTATTQKSITVTPPPVVNSPPVPQIKLSTYQGPTPLTISLDGSASTDDASIVGYTWDISDGRQVFGINQHVTFNNTGTYTITLTVTDDQGLTATTQQSITVTKPVVVEPPPNTGFGQAIIVASGGAGRNTLFEYSNEFTQRMYRILKERGFKDEDIHYINPWPPDIDLDGHPDYARHDYHLFAPAKEIAEAFSQAVANLQDGQQFIFYLHGHARQNHFSVMPRLGYELSATSLRELLATLPYGVQQVIILNTCYLGSFIDELAGVKNRVVVSSTDDQTLAWSLRYGSFADTFLSSLRRAKSVGQAFLDGQNTVFGAPKYFREQTPWLDDDSDGMYTSRDGRLAAKITIGEEGPHGAPAPRITTWHDRILLGENEANATLWVKVTPTQDQIRQVQAALINPHFVAKDYQGEATDFTREEVELIYNAAQDRYEIVYHGFFTAGTWKIFYQAQSIEGAWSDIVTSEVESQVTSLATVKMLMNHKRYTTGEQLRLDMQVNGKTNADFYVAIVFPDGDFITIAHPLNFSWPNVIQAYQNNVEITGQKVYPIMDFPLPAGIESGNYQACCVLVGAGYDPHDQANWVHVHCAGFEVY